MYIYKTIIFVSTLFLLSACGGGGSNSSNPPLNTPASSSSSSLASSISSSSSSTGIAQSCGAPVPNAIQLSDSSKALSKFEPEDGKVYFGFTTKVEDDLDPAGGDTRPMPERLCDAINIELGGKKPTILKVQSEWIDWFGNLQPFSVAFNDIEKIQAAAGTSVIPFVEWEANWLGHDSATRITTKDIAAGKYDLYIKSFAQEVITYGKPLFIRPICGEFNGSWWLWCSPKANPNLTPADFVAAWRRVVDIFHQQGVTNVAWVWTPTDALPSYNYADPNWQDYYPGDDYVDWVGGDTYLATKPKIADIFDDLYQFGIDHRKPFFLAEFGIRAKEFNYPANEYGAWLDQKFDYFESHPNVKAILYFNRNGRTQYNSNSDQYIYLYNDKVNYLPNVDDDDFRLLAGGADIRALYARRIANPRYTSSIMLPAQ